MVPAAQATAALPAAYGAAGSEANLLTDVQNYLTAATPFLHAAGYAVDVYGAGDTLAATVPQASVAGTPSYGWLTRSYGWAGSNQQTDDNAQDWNIYQSAQTTANGVAIDPDTATSSSFGQWAVCFASGTLIRTIAGDVVVTASGEHRPIRWLLLSRSMNASCRSARSGNAGAHTALRRIGLPEAQPPSTRMKRAWPLLRGAPGSFVSA